MTDPLQTIADGRNAIEKLAAQLPGIQGYLDVQARRDSDAILRDHIVRRTEAEILRISDVQTQMTANLQLDGLDDIERAITRLRTFSDAVRTAAHGYSGIFSAIKIGPTQLEQIYQHDLTLLSALDSLTASVDHLVSQPSAEAIQSLQAVSAQLVSAFTDRKNLFVHFGNP